MYRSMCVVRCCIVSIPRFVVKRQSASLILNRFPVGLSFYRRLGHGHSSNFEHNITQ